jgi:hypothetical protein
MVGGNPEPEPESLDVVDDQLVTLGGRVGEPRALPTQDGALRAGDGPGEPLELDTPLAALWP